MDIAATLFQQVSSNKKRQSSTIPELTFLVARYTFRMLMSKYFAMAYHKNTMTLSETAKQSSSVRRLCCPSRLGAHMGPAHVTHMTMTKIRKAIIKHRPQWDLWGSMGMKWKATGSIGGNHIGCVRWKRLGTGEIPVATSYFTGNLVLSSCLAASGPLESGKSIKRIRCGDAMMPWDAGSAMGRRLFATGRDLWRISIVSGLMQTTWQVQFSDG